MSQQSKSHGRKSISANLQPRALMTPSPQLAGVWTAQILTLFPEAFPGVLGESLTGRALKDGKWALDTIDLRLFGEGKHRNVDDTPAGGGAGMVLKPNVVGAALDRALSQQKTPLPMVCLSPRGTTFKGTFVLIVGNLFTKRVNKGISVEKLVLKPIMVLFTGSVP